MPVVRMDLDAAFTLAASLQRDARALLEIEGDIEGDVSSAHELLRWGPLGSDASLRGLTDIGARLRAMSMDLEWRIRMLEASDQLVADRLGAVTGDLPDRSLDLITASTLDLASQVTGGSFNQRSAAITEAEFRSADNPAFAADFVRAVGSVELVSVWADLNSRRSAQAAAVSLASIQVYAMASLDQEAITVVSEVAVGLHFYEENRMLSVLREHFDHLDTAAHGGAPDGEVSYNDLLSASSGSGALAVAASWVIGNFNVFQFLTAGSDRHDYLDSDAAISYADVPDARSLTINELREYQRMRDVAFTVWPLLPFIDVAVQQDTASADGFLSQHDFEIALSWPGLSDHQRDAVRQIVADGAFNTRSSWRHALVVAGWLPVVGDAVDLTATLHYLSVGEWEDAGFHAIGVIPLPGFSGSNARIAREMVERYAIDRLRGAVEVGAREFVLNAGEWASRSAARGTLSDSNSGFDIPTILQDRIR